MQTLMTFGSNGVHRCGDIQRAFIGGCALGDRNFMASTFDRTTSVPNYFILLALPASGNALQLGKFGATHLQHSVLFFVSGL